MRTIATISCALLFAACAAAAEPAAPGGTRLAPGYHILFKFKFSSPDQGSTPWAPPIIGSDKTLYGTTSEGGSTAGGICELGCGTIYKISPHRLHTVLYSFDSMHGAYPAGSLITDDAGNLYGATGGGGHSSNSCLAGCGTVFKLAPDGTETVLYSFSTKSTDGHIPTGVIGGSDGALYGTTTRGGSDDCNCGTIFKLAPDGTESVLHVFLGGSDGAIPYSKLVTDAEGNLYGTTLWGGGQGCHAGPGCGTVFKLAPDGTETVLHAFQGGDDGAMPRASLIIDNSGNLYGTTSEGGGNGCDGTGCGTVFKIAPDGTETMLHAFQGGTDGAVPWAGVIADNSGNLFGTTLYGGEAGKKPCSCGTVFKLAPDGTMTLLKVFVFRHEGAPYAGLTMAKKGNLYGAASTASRFPGAIFEIVQGD